MTSTSKHAFTAGPACASGEVRDISGHLLWGGEVQPILPCGEYRGPIASVLSCAHIDGISNDEAKANAEFIAEAFTVAHETGLTPRQLAERLAFWLDFAKANIGRMDADELAAFEADRAAIAKTGGAA